MRWLALAWMCACSGASSDPGYDALLQVPGAQFRPGPFPEVTGGPATLSVTTTHASIVIGRIHEKVHGVLDAGARAAILGIVDADGAWIVPAGPPDTETPNSATTTQTIGLARDAEPGPYTLAIAAADADGRIGVPATIGFVADLAPPPDGELVIALDWDSDVDLDVHVVDPTGSEAWSGDPNTWNPPPPGDPPAGPDDFLTGGILDRDANAQCHRDGAPSEHVIWKQRTGSMGQSVDPIIPPGDYIVRVETVAMCGDPSTTWYVAAYRAGALIGAARGVSTSDDVLQPHGQGAGVTALRFTQ